MKSPLIAGNSYRMKPKTISSQAQKWEGSTTRAKARRTKRSEMGARLNRGARYSLTFRESGSSRKAVTEVANRYEHTVTMTMTELKIDGVSVRDTNGENTSNHSQRELTALVDLLQDKIFALGEQYVRGMNALAYGDGVADAKAMAGLASLVKENPAAGSVGGLSNVDNKWWRNRARTAAYSAAVTTTPTLAGHGGGAVTTNPADGGALLQVLQYEQRQLSRFGGKPDFAVCGSAFLDALEKEVRANGLMTTNGYTGTQQIDMGSIKWGGVEFKYDPSLDDAGHSKRCYWLDTDAIRLFAMQDEWRRDHTPARPSDQFVIFRSITSTGAMVASRLNSSLVIDIA